MDGEDDKNVVELRSGYKRIVKYFTSAEKDFEAVADMFESLSPEGRRELVFRSMDSDDFKYFAEFVAWELIDGGTRSGTIVLKMDPGYVTVTLTPGKPHE